MVVGAGAAGLLAGLFAARGGVRTLLLETRKEPGAKIRVSGGARCNVLPSQMQWDDFHTHGSMNAVRHVLQSWPLEQVRQFFEVELGVPLKVEATGKVFPISEDPREVVVKLLAALEHAGAALVGGFRIAAIGHVSHAGRDVFSLVSDDGRTLLASRVCLATGGLSLPKTGSDGQGFELARAGLDPESKLAALSRAGRKALLAELCCCPLRVSGNEGYRTAEVTEGGVPLSELRTTTLESRSVPGLYFAGEIVDVCGRIGGFNFLWAWVSGRKVGDAQAALQ